MKHFLQSFTALVFLCLASLLLSPLALFAQTPPNSRSYISSHMEARYLSNHLIVKFDASIEGLPDEWHTGDQNLFDIWPNTSLEESFQRLGVVRMYRAFPYASPPRALEGSNLGKKVDLTRIYKLEFQGNWSIAEAVAIINQHPEFVYVEPWYINELMYHPNDPEADTTGGSPAQWHLQVIKAFEAWDLNQGDSTIVIGVTDTGISFQHPDMQDNLKCNYTDPINGIDDDGDGYIDNFRGWDMGGSSINSTGDNDPTFVHDHGMAVTGLCGASTDNGIGAAGIGFQCKFLPIKASSDVYPQSITHGYEALVYAADHGADIINCSWGTTVETEYGRDAIAYATYNKQAIVVAACGNSGQDEAMYPAAYNEVLSVANTFQSDQIYMNSTHHYSVDVSCPGAWVMGPIAHSGYARVTGSSFSAGIVSGAIGLVMSHFPQYSPIQAAQRLRVTSDNHYAVNPAYTGKLGRGRINLLRALSDPATPSIQVLTDSIANQAGEFMYASGDTISLYMDWINFLDTTAQLEIELQMLSGGSFVQLLHPNIEVGVLNTLEHYSTTQGNAPLQFRVLHGTPLNQELHFKLVYTDSTYGYVDEQYYSIVLNDFDMNVTVNRLHTTVNSVGQFGYNDYPYNREGLGVRFDGSNSGLFEAGFLLGNSHQYVADNIRGPRGFQEQDFHMIESIRRNPWSATMDFETEARFAETGMGTEITFQTYANQDSSQYVILSYEIENVSGQPLEEVYAGVFADWNIGWFAFNHTNYDENHRMTYAHDLSGRDPNYYGLVHLSYGETTAFGATNPSTFDYTDSSKYAALMNIPDSASTAYGFGWGANVMHFLSEGPFNLDHQESHKIAFAIVGGTSLAELQAAAAEARSEWMCNIEGEDGTAGFNHSSVSDYIRLGESLQFESTDQTTMGWEWDFGDDYTASIPSPIHTFLDTGSFVVQQIVYGCDGADTATQTFTVVDCNRDAFEPNDFFESAAPLPMMGVMDNAQICAQGDEDWFMIHISARKPNLSLYLQDNGFGLFIELFDSNQQLLISSSSIALDGTPLIQNHLLPGTYYIRVSGENQNWTLDRTYRLRAHHRQTPFSSQSNRYMQSPDEGGSIHVYPNPTKDFAHFTSMVVGEVWVRDLLGRIVHKEELEVGSYSIPIGRFGKGLYLFEFRTEEGNWIERVRVE